jgi:hypothetical protein
LDPELISNLENLEILRVDSNQIRTLNSKTFAGNRKLKKISLENNKIYAIERGTFHSLNELTYLNLKENDCINKTFGDYDSKSKINLTDVKLYLEDCYKNYEIVVKECKASSRLHTTILNSSLNRVDLVGPNHRHLIIGSLSLILFIFLLISAVICVRNYKNKAQKDLEMNEPGVSFYCSQNILDSNPGTSSGPNTEKIYEFGYCPDGTVHVYDTVPKKPSEITH